MGRKNRVTPTPRGRCQARRGVYAEATHRREECHKGDTESTPK